MLRVVESASAFSLLANIVNEINASTRLVIAIINYQYSSSVSDMWLYPPIAYTHTNLISSSVKH